MIRTRPTTLIAGALIAASLLTVGLTGCGAGQVASTAEQVSNSVGGNASTGDIVVRDAVIVFGGAAEGAAVYPRGEDAPLSMTIVNEGGDADRLVAASSPFAESVEISGITDVPGGRAVVVDGEGAPSAAPTGAAPTGAAPTGAAPTRTAPTSTARPTPTATPQPAEGTSVVLTGLREDIRAGVGYPVTLTFERAGELTVSVPVGDSDEEREAAEEAE